MKKWNLLYSPDSKDHQNLDYQTLTAILLQNRKIETKEDIEKFLYPKFEDIDLKKLNVEDSQIEKAKKIISKTQKEEKTIVIYGDYDVDGVCAAAILWETLYENYKKTIPYIPHRVEEGYGLSKDGIDNILEKYPDTGLIITVDNGIAAVEAVNYAKSKGLAVIITDHHSKNDEVPDADAIIYTDQLCGAGVAYAFSKVLSKNKNNTEKHIELVALATIADCMPLLNHNRTLVKYGLQALSTTERVGLLELFDEAKIDRNTIDVYHVGFMIAPRLNASGRLASAMDSLRLLCTRDNIKAKFLARKLSGTNKDRQLMTAKQVDHAKQICANGNINKVLVVADKTYNQGVIGLIASKLTDSYYRPSIVISIGENGVSKGSARSISGINIVSLLRSVSDHLGHVGGHEMAAGFTIPTEKIELFKSEILKSAEKQFADDQFQRFINADMELPLKFVNYDLYKIIKSLSPFGISNPEPSFVAKNVIIKDVRTLGKDGKHLKFLLEQNGDFLEAIAFGFATHFNGNVGDTIDVLYAVSLDTWNGRSKIVLRVKDIH